jgi:hypothetical protein
MENNNVYFIFLNHWRRHLRRKCILTTLYKTEYDSMYARMIDSLLL